MARRSAFSRRRQRRGLGLAGFLVWLLVILGGAWLAGFGIFVAVVSNSAPPNPIPRADGIVALTGGDGRVAAGLALLAEQAAPALLISGAGRGTYLGDFTADDRTAATKFAGAITLGHDAATTRGNAIETAQWARSNNMKSLLIVTADYHMPRAIFLLRQRLPGVTLIPVPVDPPAMDHVFAPPTLRLLAMEYSKYLAVRTGLDRLTGDDLGVAP
jgi:uncharacterized SAM-binding protein YcdF (DUF218 family)